MNLDLSREHVSSSHDASTPSVTDRGRASRSSALRGLSFSAGEAALSPVQARDGAVGGGGDAQTVAAGGTAAARSGGLPHLAAIQRSFGGHDVSGVKAAVGGRAGDACAELGASAYAQGESVAFGASPSLHTAAHEAAHVVQQRAGVSLPGGVGKAGDAYERQADAVADAVVQGKSVEGLLGPLSAGRAGAAAPVQAYGGETRDYEADKGESPVPMFQNESPDIIVGEETADYGLSEVENPAMIFSDDATLGLQSSMRGEGEAKVKGMAKELYLTAEQLGAANEGLKGGRKITLRRTGATVKHRGTELLQVLPAVSREGIEDAKLEIENLGPAICGDFAALIMTGKTRRELSVKLGEEERAPIRFGGSDSKEIDRLGTHLAKSDEQSPHVAREMMDEGVSERSGQAYGERLREGKLGEQERALGINKQARAKVGEGYATFTQGAGPSGRVDHSTTEGGVERGENIWGYHFAGVVATSKDGRDQATLENFNRELDIKPLVAPLEEKITKKREELRRGNGPEVNVNELLDEETKSAVAKVDKLLNETPGKSWYFEMYGSNEGQSFHEKSAASGYFANPLTVAVTPEGPTKRKEYARGTKLAESLGAAPRPPLGIVRDGLSKTLEDGQKELRVTRDTNLATKLKTVLDRYLDDYAFFAVKTFIGEATKLGLAEIDPPSCESPSGLPSALEAARDIFKGQLYGKKLGALELKKKWNRRAVSHKLRAYVTTAIADMNNASLWAEKMKSLVG